METCRNLVTALQTGIWVHSLWLLVSSLVKCPSESFQSWLLRPMKSQLSASVTPLAVRNLFHFHRKSACGKSALSDTHSSPLAFIGECEGWKALCAVRWLLKIRSQEMISLNFLSRPDAHQDHRYVLLTLVYKSTTRDRQPCMEALWDRGREGEGRTESAEKDLSVRGRAWNHSARRICKDTKTASLWSTLDNMKIAFA